MLASLASRPRRFAVIVLAAGWLTLAASPAAADSPHAPRSREAAATLGRALAREHLDLVVARVIAPGDPHATLARPPLVTLSVERVLRGTLPQGPLRARWSPEWLNALLCGNDPGPAVSARPPRFPGPARGTRWLVAGHVSERTGEWTTWPDWRLRWSAAALATALDAAAHEEARLAAEAEAARRTRDSLAAADAAARTAVPLARLVAASTDIVVAALRPGSEIAVRETLWVAPVDTVFASLERAFGRDDRAGPPRVRLVLDVPDSPAARLLAAAPGTSRTFVLFLRRRAFMPENGGANPAHLVDPAAGALPADAATLREVRVAIARASAGGPWRPAPPSECGAPWARFASLAGDALEAARVRVLAIGARGRGTRAAGAVFGAGLRDGEAPYVPLCDAGDARTWCDQHGAPYVVRLRSADMRAWLGALADPAIEPGAVPGDSAVALVTVRAPLDGEWRSAERALSRAGLARMDAALTTSVAADSAAAWRVNYWKYAFGPPLAPARGWRLAGR